MRGRRVGSNFLALSSEITGLTQLQSTVEEATWFLNLTQREIDLRSLIQEKQTVKCNLRDESESLVKQLRASGLVCKLQTHVFLGAPRHIMRLQWCQQRTGSSLNNLFACFTFRKPTQQFEGQRFFRVAHLHHPPHINSADTDTTSASLQAARI